MKQPFDNVGVDAKQTEILALPSNIRLQVCNFMCTSLIGCLDEHFDLHLNQQAQLLAMPTDLRQRLGERIARTWESGTKVVFDKETKEEDDIPDLKEIEIIGIDDESQYPEQDMHPVPLMIRIRYKHIP